MKTKIILALLTTLSLFSCAEDEQIKMGIMDCKVDVSMVTPTTAIITVTIPKDKDNILVGSSYTRINLSDKPLNSSQNIRDEVSFTFGIRQISEDSQNNVYQFWASNLYPNTTYYVLLRTQMNHFGNGDENFYYTNESFTTAKDGDYSGLGEFRCELLDYCYSAYGLDGQLIKLKFPENISTESYYDNKLYASVYPDMQDRVKGVFLNKNDYEYYQFYQKYNIKDNELLFVFPELEKKIYYFELIGSMYYKYESYKFYDVNVRIQNSIDLSNESTK